MAIKVSQGFKRTGADAIDVDLALTKAQMLVVDDDLMPNKYFTICQDDGKLYLYNKENSFEDTTGRFRVLEGGGSGSNDYETLSNQPKINAVTLLGDKTSDDLGLQDAMDEITPQEIDKIIFGGN